MVIVVIFTGACENDKVDVLYLCMLPHVEKSCTVWAFEDELVKRQEALGVHIPIPHEWSADPRGWGLYLLMGPLTCQSNQWKKQLCERYRDLCSVFVYKHIPTAIKFSLVFMWFMWCNCWAYTLLMFCSRHPVSLFVPSLLLPWQLPRHFTFCRGVNVVR